ncbi:RES family NAD+ phosphorylase [Brevibacillus sp. Leaf182]|uniref:RES family NAD+ phosphorylase n=1 Tax=Brevibacillus sp. Leaf182 TaxID=1736290 RepID=UPI0006F7D5DA|nr:RES family NAD+ phosphorylase [Brevibacillus sp. Leaf182]
MGVKQYVKEYNGCDHCYSEWFRFYEREIKGDIDGLTRLWELLYETDTPYSEWKKFGGKIKCPNCRVVLNLNNFLIQEEKFRISMLSKLSEVLKEYIHECTYCDSAKIAAVQKYGDPFTLNFGYQLQGIFDIPDDLWDDISDNIHCSCGNQINYDDPYVTKSEVDNWFGFEDEDFKSTSLFICATFDIDKREADEFIAFLMRYPMLGLEHGTGKKIYNDIRNGKMKGFNTLEQGTVLFRGRKRDTVARHVPFVESELWASPVGVSGHGRFNPVGVPVLYLGDSIKTCLKEINIGDQEVAEVPAFILLEPIKVWDIRDTDLKPLVSLATLNNRAISKEYVFPNFLAQCCTMCNVNGIMYESVKNKKGWNIALLNYEANKTIMIAEILNNLDNQYELSKLKKLKKKKKAEELSDKFDDDTLPF